MKKLSISLFAILAIVFAVSSAFSTKKTFSDKRWFRVNSSVTLSQFLNAYNDNMASPSYPAAHPSFYDGASIPDAQYNNVLADECTGVSTDLVCALAFDIERDGVTTTILDDGDFPTPGSAVVGDFLGISYKEE